MQPAHCFRWNSKRVLGKREACYPHVNKPGQLYDTFQGRRCVIFMSIIISNVVYEIHCTPQLQLLSQNLTRKRTLNTSLLRRSFTIHTHTVSEKPISLADIAFNRCQDRAPWSKRQPPAFKIEWNVFGRMANAWDLTHGC